MNIFEKRPLCLILCIGLCGFLLFGFENAVLKIAVVAIAILLLIISAFFRKDKAKRLIILLSSVSIFVYQGAIALLSGVISAYLTPEMSSTLICAGGLLIFGLGLNMMGITKIKVADYLPALIFAPVFCMVFGFIM